MINCARILNATSVFTSHFKLFSSNPSFKHERQLGLLGAVTLMSRHSSAEPVVDFNRDGAAAPLRPHAPLRPVATNRSFTTNQSTTRVHSSTTKLTQPIRPSTQASLPALPNAHSSTALSKLTQQPQLALPLCSSPAQPNSSVVQSASSHTIRSRFRTGWDVPQFPPNSFDTHVLYAELPDVFDALPSIGNNRADWISLRSGELQRERQEQSMPVSMQVNLTRAAKTRKNCSAATGSKISVADDDVSCEDYITKLLQLPETQFEIPFQVVTPATASMKRRKFSESSAPHSSSKTGVDVSSIHRELESGRSFCPSSSSNSSQSNGRLIVIDDSASPRLELGPCVELLPFLEATSEFLKVSRRFAPSICPPVSETAEKWSDTLVAMTNRIVRPPPFVDDAYDTTAPTDFPPDDRDAARLPPLPLHNSSLTSNSPLLLAASISTLHASSATTAVHVTSDELVVAGSRHESVEYEPLPPYSIEQAVRRIVETASIDVDAGSGTDTSTKMHPVDTVELVRAGGSRSMDKLNRMYSLEHGLVLAPSSLPDSGWGVYTTRFCRKNQFVCRYDGELLDRGEAERRLHLKRHTHIRSLDRHSLIDGVIDVRAALELMC